MKHAWPLLLGLIVGLSALGAEPWRFTVPPSALKRVEVNADWRGYGQLELDVTLHIISASAAMPTVFCSLFVETKQDWWFETRREVRLVPEQRQTLRFDLGPNSADWQGAHCRRPWGNDVLRWVRCWGVKLFARESCAGSLELGEPRLALVQSAPEPAFHQVRLPATLSAGEVVPLQFGVPEPVGNPFRQRDITVSLRVRQGRSEDWVPAYWWQPYQPLQEPFADQPARQAVGRPRWQVNWRPAQPGPYRLALCGRLGNQEFTRDLGEVTVGPPAAAPPSPSGSAAAGTGTPASETPAAAPAAMDPASGGPAGFVTRRVGGSFVTLENGEWLPAPGLVSDDYWRVPLDWTPRWGHYTGLGEFEQETAQAFEDLLATTGGPARALVVCDEEELQYRAMYNWRDHPLNVANGGPLRMPAELFRHPELVQVLADRARYLWARYGHFAAVKGLVILLNRPGDHETPWLRELGRTIRRELPGVPLWCNNLELPPWSSQQEVDLSRAWHADDRLALSTQVLPRVGQNSVRVEGQFPGEAAMVATTTCHWAGAKALACDVVTPADMRDELKVLCFLRTTATRVFQSELVWLRAADTNRLLFFFDAPERWTCPAEPNARLTEYELLNVKEVGLRFFYDYPGQLSLDVNHTRLCGPYAAVVARRGPLAIEGLTVLRSPARQFEVLELEFGLNRVFNNPYDPAEVAVNIAVKGPKGQVRHHPGFFLEDYELTVRDGCETAQRRNRSAWRVRYTPVEAGVHEWTVTVRAGQETATAQGRVECQPGTHPGFVRVSPQNPSYFEFSNGTAFFPIGHNLRSPSDRRPTFYDEKTWNATLEAERQGTQAFEQWFTRMAANGENFTRMWLCPWWGGLEWNDQYPGYHGLGYYNQANATKVDRVLELAEKYGIYLNLELMNHGAISTRIDGDWPQNPLCFGQPGGFIEYATDFFTSEQAQELHQRRLRYIIARWGYSPAVAIWGLLTETEWVEAYDRGCEVSEEPQGQFVPEPYRSPRHQEAVRRWLRECSALVRQTDAHPHLVTTHFSNPNHGMEVWAGPELQVMHNNAYTLFAEGGIHWQEQCFEGATGVADVMYAYDRAFRRLGNKPLLIGEWGGDPVRNRPAHLRQELHTGIWAAYMTTGAGVTGYWWWNLLDSENLYPHFRALAAFAAGEDRRPYSFQCARVRVLTADDDAAEDVAPAAQSAPAHRPNALGLGARDRAYAYVYVPQINEHRHSRVASGADDPNFPLRQGDLLLIPTGLRPGKWEVEYWNTFTGQVLSKQQVTVRAGPTPVPLLDYRVDLALKLRCLEPGPDPGPAPSGRGVRPAPARTPAPTPGR